MDDEIFEKYLKAGKAVAAALKLAKKLARPGTNLEAFAELVEGEVRKNGCELAFPLNISIDNIAAHYSPVIGDTHKIPEKGLMKIDCGAHIDGYIADAAITVNLGDEGGVYKSLCDAARDALEDALKAVKPDVKVSEIGRIIKRAIEKYDLKPISNLGGHGLEKYNLHAAPFIPNTPHAGGPGKLKKGGVYAIEPFATNGAGRVRNGKEITIYHVHNINKKTLKLNERVIARKFKEKFGSLPFSPRAVDFIPKHRINNTIDYFHRIGVLYGYPVFVEVGNGLVSQEEHTFILTEEGPIITTKSD